MRPRAIVCLLVVLAVNRSGWAQADRVAVSRMANAAEVRKRLGLVPEYENFAGIEAVKVAVLDYGFEGMAKGRPYLPQSAEIVENYDPDFVRRFNLGDPEFRKGFEPGNRHGRVMAQIVWEVTGGHPGGPKFYLLNANGPTMLRRAVRYAIEQKVDVILFSGTFEGGGSGDGRGSINRIVDDAIAAGILWVNAAGNYGKRVYNGPVKVLNDGYLRLRNGSDVASLRFRNHLDENTVTVTLTWNDYRGEEDAGTDKDLDLFVEDWAGRPVGSGEKRQVSGDKVAGPDESRNPRERVVLANLAATPNVPNDPDYGYRIRIKARSGQFTPADRIRVLITAAHDFYQPPNADSPRDAINFLDASNQGELYPPADNPLVLTVGDPDPSSSLGPTIDNRIKPDAILDDSRAFFTDGEVSAGTSNAAAYVAGVIVTLKAAAPALQPRHLIRLTQLAPLVPTAATRDRAMGIHIWQTPSRTRLRRCFSRSGEKRFLTPFFAFFGFRPRIRH